MKIFIFFFTFQDFKLEAYKYIPSGPMGINLDKETKEWYTKWQYVKNAQLSEISFGLEEENKSLAVSVSNIHRKKMRR